MAGSGKSVAECGWGRAASRGQSEQECASTLRPLVAAAGATGFVRLAISGTLQRNPQFVAHGGEITFYPAIAANQHVVVIRQTVVRQGFAQQFPEAPLHPVAHDRIADLLGHSDPVPEPLTAIGTRKQDEARACNTQSAIRRQKVCAPGEDLRGHEELDRVTRRVTEDAARKNGSREGPVRPNGHSQRGSLPARLTRTLTRTGERKQSSRQFVATATTAVAQDLAATRGGLTGEETVATSAHKVARLESALHGKYLQI